MAEEVTSMPESGSGSDLCTTIPAFIKLIIEKIIVALIRSRTTIILFRIKNISESQGTRSPGICPFCNAPKSEGRPLAIIQAIRSQ